MNILALDTSTEACSAALTVSAELRERFVIAPREHSGLILPMVESLLSEAGLSLSQLDAIAFGCGPGSFTGLRIAAGVVQGLAFGADLPVLPISTLAALAQGAHTNLGKSAVLAALDARMGEVYWGIYKADSTGIMMLQGVEGVCDPQLAPLPKDGDWHGAGSGWKEYGALLQTRCGARLRSVEAERLPHARHIALLAHSGLQKGLAVNAEHALPVYLRNEVAWKKHESL